MLLTKMPDSAKLGLTLAIILIFVPHSIEYLSMHDILIIHMGIVRIIILMYICIDIITSLSIYNIIWEYWDPSLPH